MQQDSTKFATLLRDHAAECSECGAAPLPLPRIEAALTAAVVDVDATALSQRVLVQLRPELQRRASAVLWRRVIAGILLALLPLPAVVAYDAYVLQAIYALVSAWLPSAFAAYIVLSYAAFLVLLFAVTYAAIPLLVMREPEHHLSAAG